MTQGETVRSATDEMAEVALTVYHGRAHRPLKAARARMKRALDAALAAAPSPVSPTPGTANELEAVARVVGMERAEQLLGGSLTREAR